jgi:hypothetical protein
MRWSEDKTKKHRRASAFFRHILFFGCGAVLFEFTAYAAAQVSTPTTRKVEPQEQIRAEHAAHKVRRNASSVEAQKEQKEAPKTPSDVAARLPEITLSKGSLTVDADNADLSAILNGVAHASGMKIDGNAGNARVFGVYGPGNPRQVLTELLDGVGYNFMMVGDNADGTPGELLLTAKSGAPSAKPPTAASASEDDDAADSQDEQEPPGPGAVMHVPPSVAQQADDSQTQQRVQQNLQRLQQMHDALEQRQQQNQPQ